MPRIYLIKSICVAFFMDKKNQKIRLSEITGLPKDVILGVPILTITGQSEACIENYRGILEYTNQLIRIQTKIGKIHITGRNLQIECYTNDEMKIVGHISLIEFHEGG